MEFILLPCGALSPNVFLEQVESEVEHNRMERGERVQERYFWTTAGDHISLGKAIVIIIIPPGSHSVPKHEAIFSACQNLP